MIPRYWHTGCLVFFVWSLALLVSAQSLDEIRKARAAGVSVGPSLDGAIYAEAEEFVPIQPGWKPRPWGENYYAATFANTFLSRKHFLQASASEREAVAQLPLQIDEAGSYLVLARYEAPYRYQAQFRIQIEQADEIVFDRLYGALSHDKIWAFHRRVQPQVKWHWGAVENIVWEGHTASVDLASGPAVIRLIAVDQPAPAGDRNVDLIMLTQDVEDVEHRIERERFLPLDGLLTQQGDLFLSVSVPEDAADLRLAIPTGAEHSPYWVHMRKWQAKALRVSAGTQSEWLEIGSNLDALNDSRLFLRAESESEDERPLKYQVRIGLNELDGTVKTIAEFDCAQETLALIIPGDVRYRPDIITIEQRWERMVASLEAADVKGRRPTRMPVFAYSARNPSEPFDGPYNRMSRHFAGLYGITPLGHFNGTEPTVRGLLASNYVDVRHTLRSAEQFDSYLTELPAAFGADLPPVFSFGDEISLPKPDGPKMEEAFSAWLEERGKAAILLEQGDPRPTLKELLALSPTDAQPHAAAYMFARKFSHEYGISSLKVHTDLMRSYYPTAVSGANFSPHHGVHYLGTVYQWIHAFRREGMLLPWSEGYAWQVPIGSQQMYTIPMAQFRSGIRQRPADPILWYVMTHTPGNTPSSWRREFYTALAYGAKIIHLYQFMPLGTHGRITENYTEHEEIYHEVLRGMHELGMIEDWVLDGVVRNGKVGFWFSEASDVWDDSVPPFGAAKRGLYIAALHQHPFVDVLIEEDTDGNVLDEYEIILITDQTVSTAAFAALTDWVEQGGTLILTGLAASRTEFAVEHHEALKLSRQNPASAKQEPSIQFIKQDLIWAEPLEHVHVGDDGAFPAYGVAVRLDAQPEDNILATYQDGSVAAIRHRLGSGEVISMGFLPGLAYFAPAMPNRPVDRGSTDEAMSHFIPTDFDPLVSKLLREAIKVEQVVATSSHPLVAFRIIDAPGGRLIPLVNWSGAPIENMTLRLPNERADEVFLASGARPRMKQTEEGLEIQFALDVADALVIKWDQE